MYPKNGHHMLNNKRIKYAAGVLIMGSLYWDSGNKDFPEYRKEWRQKRLNMRDSIHVKLPIRYGRKSSNGNYTMVLSKELELKGKIGAGYLVPFKNTAITLNGLISQAKFLSEAEGKKINKSFDENSKFVKGGKKKWAVISILINPDIDGKKRVDILNKWDSIINQQNIQSQHKEFRIGNEPSHLSQQGELLIDWIKSVDGANQEKVNQFDVLLITATKPNIQNYPEIGELRTKIYNDERKYFYKNIENGIYTFQDYEIINAPEPNKS